MRCFPENLEQALARQREEQEAYLAKREAELQAAQQELEVANIAAEMRARLS